MWFSQSHLSPYLCVKCVMLNITHLVAGRKAERYDAFPRQQHLYGFKKRKLSMLSFKEFS